MGTLLRCGVGVGSARRSIGTRSTLPIVVLGACSKILDLQDVTYDGGPGMYFPNGVTCGPTWSSTNSAYSDTAGFCNSLTGSPVIQVFYTCSSSVPRSTWFNHVWGTFLDNGYTQNVQCYYP